MNTQLLPRVVLFFATVLLWLPTQAAQVTLDGQTFTLPEGFEIERVAGPSLVERPISASFDDEGRLYVTDSSGSNEKPDKQLLNPTHRVVRLEDTDGDGRYDRSVVFAEKLMFPEGCLWHAGSLYIGAPPSVWKLTDADGDGTAESRVEWFKQGVLTGCANDVHGPYLGPDGWLYWTKGAFAELNLIDGRGQAIKDRCAHIFRRHPDGSGLESIMAGGMDNPVEVDFTREGEAMFTSTFLDLSGPGKRDGLGHAVYGGVFPKINDVTEGVRRTGELLPAMTHFGPGAPSGLCRYQASSFGADFQDNLFATLFNLHKVTRHQLRAQGGSFRTEDSDFVVSDSTDFHPTDVLEDADGSLLIVDTGGWYKLCCPTSQLAKPDVLGGIYRVRRKGVPRLQEAWGRSIAWNQLSPMDLTAYFSSASWSVRRKAADALVKQGKDATAAVAKMLRQGKTLAERYESAWVLMRMGSPEAHQSLLDGALQGDPSVRRTAVKALGLNRVKEAAEPLAALLESSDAGLARVAAEALGRIGDPRHAESLLAAAPRSEGDRFLEHSIIYALIELGAADPLTRSLAAAHPQTRRVALIALDQLGGGLLRPDQALAFLGVRHAGLREAAQWVVSHHPAWGAALGGYFAKSLAARDLDSNRGNELEQQLARLASSKEIQQLLAQTVADTAASALARAASIRAMARAGLRETPVLWLENLSAVLPTIQNELLRDAVRTARALPSPKGGHAKLEAALLAVGGDTRNTAETRIDALAAIPAGLREVNGEVFAFLLRRLDPVHSVAVRGGAALVLAKSQLTQEQLAALADAMAAVGPMEIGPLLGAFDKTKDEAIGLKLVGGLAQSKGLAGLRPDQLQSRLTNFPEVVRQKGAQLIAAMGADEAGQRARLDQLLAELNANHGDVRRGQAIFNSTKAACASCHAIGYLGGKTGPDLTSIGQVRTERDLLEAIVFPSASFVRSYEPLLVATSGGDEHSGILTRENTEEVVLTTGPDAEVRLARADISAMRPGRLSMMPQGLDEQLSRQELADLLAFLKNTRWGAQ